MKFLIDGDIKLDSEVWIDKNGYARHGADKYVHRTVMEVHIGRNLETAEVVHHIDHNKLNNVRSNLLVCTQKEHIIIHAKDRAKARGINLDTHSYCGSCKDIKPIEEFGANKRLWRGINTTCRTCCAKSKARRGWNVRANRPNKWKDLLGQQYRRARHKPGVISWLT